MGEGFPGGGMSWGGMNWGGMNRGQTASNSSNEIDNSKGAPTGVSDNVKGKKIKKLKITGPLKEFYQMPSDDMDSNAVSDNGGLKESDIDRKNVDTTPEQITQANVEVGDEPKERDTDWEDVEATPEQLAEANRPVDEGSSEEEHKWNMPDEAPDPSRWDMPGDVPDPFELDLFEEESDEDKKDAQNEVQPEAQPEVQPEAQPEVQPEAQPEVQPEIQPEARPRARSEAQPKSEMQPKREAKKKEEVKSGKEREMSRVESKMRHYKEEYNRINSTIEDIIDENRVLSDQIRRIDRALKKNAKERDIINKKIEEKKKIVADTKNSMMSGVTTMFKLVKELALGKHDEVDRILDGLKNRNRENRDALEALEVLYDDLENNERSRQELMELRYEKVNSVRENEERIKSQQKKRAEARKNFSLLRDEANSERRAEEWEGWKEGREKARSEILGRDRFKAKKLRSWEQIDEELDRMERAFGRDRERQIAEIEQQGRNGFMRGMMERLGVTKEDWEEQIKQEKQRVEDKYDERMDILRRNRNEVYAAFPTREERAKAKREMLGEDATIRGALNGLKRKVLLRMRGII